MRLHHLLKLITLPADDPAPTKDGAIGQGGSGGGGGEVGGGGRGLRTGRCEHNHSVMLNEAALVACSSWERATKSGVGLAAMHDLSLMT